MCGSTDITSHAASHPHSSPASARGCVREWVSEKERERMCVCVCVCVWERERECVNEIEGALWGYLCLRCHWSCLFYIPSISLSTMHTLPLPLSLPLFPPSLPLSLSVSPATRLSFHQFLCASLCICFSLSLLLSAPLLFVSVALFVCLVGKEGLHTVAQEKTETERGVSERGGERRAKLKGERERVRRKMEWENDEKENGRKKRRRGGEETETN